MSNDAFQNTFRVLNKRIDQFGVAQRNINSDPRKGTISVELPGVKDDPERVRKILQATANLQFWKYTEVMSWEYIIHAGRRNPEENG